MQPTFRTLLRFLGNGRRVAALSGVRVDRTLIGAYRVYLGILGGVLMLTALHTLLVGATLPFASRPILFGLGVLAAAVGLRERRL